MEDVRLTSRIDEIAQRFADVPGGLMPALHAVQHELGLHRSGSGARCWPACSTSRSRRCTVSSASTPTSAPPPPRGPIVQICRAEACQARGADAVDGARSRSVRLGCTGRAGRGVLPRQLRLGAVGGHRRPALRTSRSRRCRAVCSTMRSPPDAVNSGRGGAVDASRNRHGLRADRRRRSFGRSRRDRRRPRRVAGGSRRAQRVARLAVARADDRGRDARGSRRLRTGPRRRRVGTAERRCTERR